VIIVIRMMTSHLLVVLVVLLVILVTSRTYIYILCVMTYIDIYNISKTEKYRDTNL
jgi:predicted branched-subunit amino acid permease